ncbi:MAG: DUF2490 domain-containing protein [Verrucomicrobia bacterium]|nr:DUF2490 domain-containing protein [Verrucomicrobiota bacterium]
MHTTFVRGMPCGMLVLMLASLPIISARAGDSWQVWMGQGVDQAVTKRTTLRAAQSFQYAIDSGALATYYVDAGGGVYVTDWLDLGAAYRQQYDKRDGHWQAESRPYGDATLFWKSRWVTLSDRNRLEYRNREEQSDTLRYRNKLTVQYHARSDGVGFKPYVAMEAFADESARLRERDRMRFTLGVRREPQRGLLRKLADDAGRALTMDWYVTEQRTKKANDWTNEYIAGIKIGIHF